MPDGLKMVQRYKYESCFLDGLMIVLYCNVNKQYAQTSTVLNDVYLLLFCANDVYSVFQQNISFACILHYVVVHGI